MHASAGALALGRRARRAPAAAATVAPARRGREEARAAHASPRRARPLRHRAPRAAQGCACASRPCPHRRITPRQLALDLTSSSFELGTFASLAALIRQLSVPQRRSIGCAGPAEGSMRAGTAASTATSGSARSALCLWPCSEQSTCATPARRGLFGLFAGGRTGPGRAPHSQPAAVYALEPHSDREAALPVASGSRSRVQGTVAGCWLPRPTSSRPGCPSRRL